MGIIFFTHIYQVIKQEFNFSKFIADLFTLNTFICSFYFRNKNEGNSLKTKLGNQSNGTKAGGKSSSKSGNTLTVGARRERSSSLANIYTRPRR